MQRTRRHTSSLIVPAKEKRKDRRARRRTERELAAELARAEKQEQQARGAAERQQRRDQPYLPRAGDHVEGPSKSAVATKLFMSRTTVHRLLDLGEPPWYRRRSAGSQVDQYAEAIAAMLAEDPRVPATVIAQRLRPLGYRGSLTILKDHLRRVRPNFTTARSRSQYRHRRHLKQRERG